MPRPPIEVGPCPIALSREALALAMADLTPEQRREFAPVDCRQPVEALVVALEGSRLCGAAWGQRQPGSTAILWPPRVLDGVDSTVEGRLTIAVAKALDDAGIRMAQVLLSDRSSPLATTLRSAGFTCLTELLYLNWECRASEVRATTNIEFEPYSDAALARLRSIVERTYEATQDCPALGGQRPVEEVLDGYRATGAVRPDCWWYVRSGGADVGVLLLTEHATANHWELLYMGLVPSVRGRKLGSAVVQHAQRLAQAAGAERLVLAVDAENHPAIKMYNNTGFVVWDRRTVFVRFRGGDSESTESP
jgi:ribosomal protein S18 acetylase RimI-like enzyme